LERSDWDYKRTGLHLEDLTRFLCAAGSDIDKKILKLWNLGH
jgi:hypothetical protein